MRYIVIIFFISSNCSAQNSDLLSAILHKEKVVEYFNDKKYDSVIFYHSQNKHLATHSFPDYRVETLVSLSYLELGNIDSGLFYMEKGFRNSISWDAASIRYAYKKYKLDNDPRYQSLLVHIDPLQQNRRNKINIKLREKYLKIYYTDQHFRKYIYDHNDTINKEIYLKLFNKTDSVNALRIVELIKLNNGFPTEDDIGENELYFVIYHVSKFLDMEYILIEIRKATLAGRLSNNYGPALIDYIRRGDGLVGLYGLKTFTNTEGKKQFSEIEDIKNLDKRRIEYLLPSLRRQAQIHNVILPQDYSPSEE